MTERIKLTSAFMREIETEIANEEEERLAYPVDETFHPLANEINVIVRRKIYELSTYLFPGLTKTKKDRQLGGAVIIYALGKTTDKFVKEACEEKGWPLPIDWRFSAEPGGFEWYDDQNNFWWNDAEMSEWWEEYQKSTGDSQS